MIHHNGTEGAVIVCFVTPNRLPRGIFSCFRLVFVYLKVKGPAVGLSVQARALHQSQAGKGSSSSPWQCEAVVHTEGLS